MRSKLSTAISLVKGAGFPWTQADRGQPGAGALIRRRGRQAIVRGFPAPARPIAAVAMTLCWPVAAARQAWIESGRVAPGRFPGLDRAAIARSLMGAALRHNVPPIEGLSYRLIGEREIRADAWIYDLEVTWLLRQLNNRQATALAADKVGFARFCQERGLAHAPVLAVIDGAQLPAEPDCQAIVVKPRRGSNARGVAVWFREADGWTREEGAGPYLPWSTLAEALRRDGETIVQPRLKPHADFEHLPGPGAVAARLITGERKDGSIELLASHISAPRAGSSSSNGGSRRLIDPANGRTLPLGPGRNPPVWSDPDPDRGLDGLTVPDWQRAVDLVLAAHRAFPSPAVLLGWDVAFAPDGPVLIETNVGVSFFLEQMETLEPAGDGPAGHLIASWLQ